MLSFEERCSGVLSNVRTVRYYTQYVHCDCPLDHLANILLAAVQILMARIEENPLSDWANLATQIVRAALDCQGRSSFISYVIVTHSSAM